MHPRTRKGLIVLAAGTAASTAAVGLSSAAQGASATYTTPLFAHEETTSPDTHARGVAQFRLSNDGTELSYRLVVANIDDVLMAHIHLGDPGVDGAVVTWLYPSGPPPQLIAGTTQGVLATGTITSADLGGPRRAARRSGPRGPARHHGCGVDVRQRAHQREPRR